MPELTIGTGRCRCGACGAFFGGVSGFDRHQRLGRDGALRCLDPATVGLTLSPDGWWCQEAPALNCGVGQDATNAGVPAFAAVAAPASTNGREPMPPTAPV